MDSLEKHQEKSFALGFDHHLWLSPLSGNVPKVLRIEKPIEACAYGERLGWTNLRTPRRPLPMLIMYAMDTS
jgi:hypothetical protein